MIIKKTHLLIIFVVIFTILFVYFLINFSKPKSSNNPSQIKTFKFITPKNYNKEAIPTTDGRIIENWKLTENNSSPTLIYVTLISSTKDLGDFEPVQERRSNPLQYTEEVGRMKNKRGILFRTIDQKERDVFFSNKNQILLVYYIAKTTDPSKETEFAKFIDNISWQ